MSTTKFSNGNSFSRTAIGRRVRQIRGPLTYQAFATRLGVSPGFLNEIEHGRKKPSAEMLFALESEFGVDVNWLLRGDIGEPHLAETPPRYGAARPKTGQEMPLFELGEPDLGEVLHTLRLPPAYSGPTMIAVRAADDSMAPALPAGAVAGVDQSRKRATNGVLQLLMVKSAGRWTTTIRRVYRLSGGLRLRAENERYGDVIIKRADARVLGHVVWILRNE